MGIRAGVVILADEKLVLIERVKANRTYYVVPGGGVHEGEYTHQAACREAKEELGVDVTLERLVAVVERVEHGAVTHLQMYYLVGGVSGLFGSGTGEEYGRSEAHGTYRPIWLRLAELEKHPVYPSVLAAYLTRHGVPKSVLHLYEPDDYPS